MTGNDMFGMREVFMKIKYNEKNELDLPISRKLETNIETLQTIFSDWGDFVEKKICTGKRK